MPSLSKTSSIGSLRWLLGSRSEWLPLHIAIAGALRWSAGRFEFNAATPHLTGMIWDNTQVGDTKGKVVKVVSSHISRPRPCLHYIRIIDREANVVQLDKTRIPVVSLILARYSSHRFCQGLSTTSDNVAGRGYRCNEYAHAAIPEQALGARILAHTNSTVQSILSPSTAAEVPQYENHGDSSIPRSSYYDSSSVLQH